MYNYPDIYPELVNKIRWAICTSVKTPESNYPYSAAQRLATVLAQDAIGLIKLEQEAPGSLGSPAIIRKSIRQWDLEVLDSLTAAG